MLYWISRTPFQYPIRRLIVTSRKVEAARFIFRVVQSPWTLTGASAALLSMCLSDFKAMRWFELPISRFRDFTRSYDETSYWILKRGQGSCCPWGKVSTIFAMPMSRDGTKSKYVYMFSTLNHHGPAPHICIAIFNACLPSAPNMRRWLQWSSPQCHIYGALYEK